jgi:twitching motility protein PilT
LNASETGHLVLATVHSATCAEALQRVISAFPAEIQSSVAGQLADCLLAVISQRLRFRPELNIRVPECEILMTSHAVKNFVRTRDFYKIASAIETGAEHGMWTFTRYRTWLDNRKKWHIPDQSPEEPDTEVFEPALPAEGLPALGTGPRSQPAERPAIPRAPVRHAPGRIEIEPVEGEFGKILKRPGE